MTVRKPRYAYTKIASSRDINFVKKTLDLLKLNVICYEASCPNTGKCFSKKQTTFLILGKNCSRNCLFCNVEKNIPLPLDYDEPRRAAMAASLLELKYAVITSPTRDDLKDGGAEIFALTVKFMRQKGIKTEVLIPDFKGDTKNIDKIITAAPEVISHNIEMAESLYPLLRSKSDFKTSLRVLKYLKSKKQIVKTAFLIGFGETEEEILKLIDVLSFTDILYIGHYLQPTKKHFPVKKYYKEEDFKKYKEYALKKIKIVKSAPLVRSSYEARSAFEEYNKVNEIPVRIC